jgi:tetratricopeptide (TPR) repeat protein
LHAPWILSLCAAVAGGAKPPAIAIRNVNLVPMDEERVVPGQTVVARDGSIVAIGKADEVEIPPGAQVIEGEGAFLLPGLADLHVHSQRPDDLLLYVANGVTTVLNMGLAWPSFVTHTRARIRAGELVAPTCFVAPMMNGPRGSDLPCATVDEARASVRLAKETGYEFIKVYNDLTRPLFHAICEEAHAQGLAVVGHGVRAPGLAESFEAGQVMVAHGEEFLYTILKGRDRPGTNDPVDAARVPEAVALTKRFGVYVEPNLSAYEVIAAQWGKQAVADEFLRRPESRFMRPYWRRQWAQSRYADERGSLAENLVFLRTFTKSLHDAGVKLLLATDSPDIPGMEAGFSIHDDLRNLVEAGLTPFEAISCGTRVAGEFIAECVPDAAGFGTIELGQRADLVLVAKNPLEDVANLKRPLGVLLRGRWYSRAELSRLLDEMAARFQKTAAAEDAFLLAGAKSGFTAACAAARADGSAAFLDDETLNTTGYQLLRAKKQEEALAVFELNTQVHPDSPNAFDSYGETLAAAGRAQESRAAYEKELALDPQSVLAKRALGK